MVRLKEYGYKNMPFLGIFRKSSCVLHGRLLENSQTEAPYIDYHKLLYAPITKRQRQDTRIYTCKTKLVRTWGINRITVFDFYLWRSPPLTRRSGMVTNELRLFRSTFPGLICGLIQRKPHFADLMRRSRYYLGYWRYKDTLEGTIFQKNTVKNYHNPDGVLPLFEVHFNWSEYNVLLKEMFFPKYWKK